MENTRSSVALFIIGSKRLHVNFEIPAYKFSYMGKAGGGNSVAAGSNPGRLTYSTQEVFR